MTELGRRIAAARAYGGIRSQAALAEELGFSQSTIQRIETGGRGLRDLERREALTRIAAACGVPYEWFTVDDLPGAVTAYAEANPDAVLLDPGATREAAKKRQAGTQRKRAQRSRERREEAPDSSPAPPRHLREAE